MCKKYIFIIMACLISTVALQAQTYEEYLKQNQEQYQQYSIEEQKGIQKMFQEYDDYVAKVQAEYNDFKANAQKIWGKGNVVESTPKDWVEYSDDMMTRSIVDFENGTATVQVALKPGETPQEAVAATESAVNELLSSQGTTCDYASKVEPRTQLKDYPILQGIVDVAESAVSTATETAKAILKENKPEISQTTTSDGKKQEVVTVTFKLLPNATKKLAAEYKDQVQSFAKKNGLNPCLVYAVIHTESYFNPKAKSSAPAYGLMQLVPKSGGREAYRFVHKKDYIPMPVYLYDPTNNIELGSGYLNYLMNVQFKNIKDETSRMYCAIAAYNTGAGNVCRAFTGKTKIDSAVEKINAMSSKAVYEHLRKHLPYEETRNYLKKVSERMDLYK